jgi:hypothetical protein
MTTRAPTKQFVLLDLLPDSASTEQQQSFRVTLPGVGIPNVCSIHLISVMATPTGVTPPYFMFDLHLSSGAVVSETQANGALVQGFPVTLDFIGAWRASYGGAGELVNTRDRFTLKDFKVVLRTYSAFSRAPGRAAPDPTNSFAGVDRIVVQLLVSSQSSIEGLSANMVERGYDTNYDSLEDQMRALKQNYAIDQLKISRLNCE